MSVAVVILAGGEGRRLGGAKPLRHVAGERLIDRALQQARAWSDQVAVGLRDPAQAGQVDVPLIRDVEGIEGPLAGLAAGLRFARGRSLGLLLTIPADMPFLPPDLLQRLQAALGDRAVALASSGGRLHPVCALWRTEVLEAVPGYLAGQRRSLGGLAETVGCVRVDWSTGTHDPFFNVNFPEDLCEAERRLRNR